MKRFLLLGENSSGKSCFINYLSNYLNGERNPDRLLEIPNLFYSLVHDGQSTEECHEYYFNLEMNKNFTLIDTPSLNENDTSLGLKFSSIVEAMRRKNRINAFIIILNGTFVEPSHTFINLLLNLSSIISESVLTKILEQSILVLTNCDRETRNFNEKSLLIVQDKLKHIFLMQNNFLNIKNSILNYQSTHKNLKSSFETIAKILELMVKTEPIELDLIFEKNQEEHDNPGEYLIEKLVLKKDLSYLATLITHLNQLQEEKAVIEFNLENIVKDHERAKLIFKHDYIEPLIYSDSQKQPLLVDLSVFENSIKTCKSAINKLNGRIALRYDEIERIFGVIERKFNQMKGIVREIDFETLLFEFSSDVGHKNKKFTEKLSNLFKAKREATLTIFKNKNLDLTEQQDLEKDMNTNGYCAISDDEHLSDSEQSIKLNEIFSREQVKDYVIKNENDIEPLASKEELFLVPIKNQTSSSCSII